MRAYTGEYLVSPVGVHFGLNFCSHSCWYCFANLNQPQRRADFSLAMNTLRKAAGNGETKDIGANLLRAGHRILCANDSDPFAVSNSDAFHQVYDFARERGFLFAFQTRGGEHAICTLEEHPPTFVYVSLTGDDDAAVKAAEPGAPSFGSRMELIAAAKAAGHNVVAGINPYRPSWWKDTDGLVQKLADLGVHHAWTGLLHMSYHQRDAMKPKVKERHEAEITYAMAKVKPDLQGLYYLDRELVAAGINVFGGAVSKQGHFWDEYASMATSVMPTMDALFDHFRAVSGGKRVVISFDWFAHWCEQFHKLPDLRASAFKEYLNSFGRTLRNMGEDTRANSFRDMHETLWRVMDLPTPFDRAEFAVAIAEDTDDAPVLTDDDGRPLLVWNPELSEEPVEPVDDSPTGDDAVWLTRPPS